MIAALLQLKISNQKLHCKALFGSHRVAPLISTQLTAASTNLHGSPKEMLASSLLQSVLCNVSYQKEILADEKHAQSALIYTAFKWSAKCKQCNSS